MRRADAVGVLREFAFLSADCPGCRQAATSFALAPLPMVQGRTKRSRPLVLLKPGVRSEKFVTGDDSLNFWES